MQKNIQIVLIIYILDLLVDIHIDYVNII